MGGEIYQICINPAYHMVFVVEYTKKAMSSGVSEENKNLSNWIIFTLI